MVSYLDLIILITFPLQFFYFYLFNENFICMCFIFHFILGKKGVLLKAWMSSNLALFCLTVIFSVIIFILLLILYSDILFSFFFCFYNFKILSFIPNFLFHFSCFLFPFPLFSKNAFTPKKLFCFKSLFMYSFNSFIVYM